MVQTDTGRNRPRSTTRLQKALFALASSAALMAQAQTGTIQLGSGTETNQLFPTNSCWTYNYSQQIYLADELASGGGAAGEITAIRFYYVDGGTDFGTWNDWTVSMANTTQSEFTSNTDWVDPVSLTQVFSGVVQPSAGSWMEIILDTPFIWDGTSNVVVTMYEQLPNYSCTASWRSYTTTGNRALLYYADPPGNPDPAAPPAANEGPDNFIAQVQFEGTLASCLAPADIAANTITSSSASITWTDNGSESYDYEIRTSGAAGSGPDGLFTSGNVTSGTPAIDIPGLDPNTNYSVYVRGNCTDGNSAWSFPFGFLTPCVAVDVPYLENFNSTNPPDIPNCMALETISGQPWYTVDFPITGMTGNCALVSYDWQNGQAGESWLFTGGVNLQGGVSYRISYKYGTGSQFSYENFGVYYGTGQSAADTISSLFHVEEFTSETALSNSEDFIPDADGIYYFGFRYYSPSFTDEVFLDDIKVVLTPTCEEVTDLIGASTTDTDGQVSWTASISNPAGGYDVYYSTEDTPPDGTTVPSFGGVMGTSQPISGLDTGVPVYVWVRAHCSDTDQSYWTGPATFTPGTYQIGSGEATSEYYPIYSCYGYSYSQQIYLASEYAGGHLITKIRFKYMGGADDFTTWQDWTVYMGNTTQSEFNSTTDWVPYSALTQVFSGTVAPVAGEWLEIVFTTPFLWDGTSNFVVAVDENTPNYYCTADWASFSPGTNRGLLNYNDNINPDPLSPPEANQGPSSSIDQIQLEGIVPEACDAMPDPGSTTGPSSICPNTPFVVGIENGTVTSGISYQWQTSTNSTDWTDVTDLGTYASYITSETEDTWYRVQVACDATGTTASEPLLVTVNPPTECYCSPTFVYDVTPICNVNFADIDNSSSSVYDGSPALEDFTATPPANVVSGFDFPISVTGYAQFATSYINVFFDWDQDGTFETMVPVGSTMNNICSTPATATVTVPASALTGTTRMRVMKVDYETPYDACGLYFDSGQAEDYLVNVFPPTDCDVMPTPGATTGPSSICPQEPFSVGIEGALIANGISYQWQTSSDGTNWTDAPGNSTMSHYSTSQTVETWYRVEMTCDVAGTATSTPLDVAMAPPNECYCDGVNFVYEVDPICHVVFSDIDNTSSSEIGGTPAFEDFSSVVGHVYQSHSYDLTVTGTTNAWDTYYANAFFDWDGNGIYETLWNLGSVTNDLCTTPMTTTITVPASAHVGLTRVRILFSGYSGPNDPCETYDEGQAEEYTLDVAENVGIEEFAERGTMAVFPNPASTTLFLSTPDNQALHVKVYDVVGHLVMEKAMVRQLNISGLATGSYTLMATDGNGGHLARARFMKQ
jgi:hypothetical protein